MDKKMSAKECMMNDDELEQVNGGATARILYKLTCLDCGKKTAGNPQPTECSFCHSTNYSIDEFVL